MHARRLAAWLGATAMVVAFAAGLGVGARAAGQAGVSLTTGAACDGLSQSECCAQTLKTHAFRAVGERLPKRGRLVVDLACKQPKRKLPQTSCRSLLVARGFSVGDANKVCKQAGLGGRCKQQKACRQCVSAMSKLGYRAAAPACLAATRVVGVAAQDERRVVIRAEGDDADGIEIVRRRTVVR